MHCLHCDVLPLPCVMLTRGPEHHFSVPCSKERCPCLSGPRDTGTTQLRPPTPSADQSEAHAFTSLPRIQKSLSGVCEELTELPRPRMMSVKTSGAWVSCVVIATQLLPSGTSYLHREMCGRECKAHIWEFNHPDLSFMSVTNTVILPAHWTSVSAERAHPTSVHRFSEMKAVRGKMPATIVIYSQNVFPFLKYLFIWLLQVSVTACAIFLVEHELSLFWLWPAGSLLAVACRVF